MKISDFTQNIIIKRLSLDGDFGFGNPNGTETTILSTKGSVKEINRTSAVMQNLSVEEVNYKLTIRFAAGRMINKADIVIWNGKRMKAITSSTFKEIDKKRYLETILIDQDA